MQQTILLTGGTGLVGTGLTRVLLHAGHKVIVLTRNPTAQSSHHPHLQYAGWNVKAGTIDTAALASADAIVHLAGAGVVAKPWTAAYRKEIVDSRVQSGELLVHALRSHSNKVSVVVSASAIGWYGADKGQGAFVETDPADASFLGDTCAKWEAAIAPVALLGKRLVIGRIGIVLANEGGALPEFKKPLEWRIAGVLGHGQQMVSWVHMTDLCHFFLTAIQSPALQGVYNVVAPQPVSNKALTLALAKAMYGNSYITLPVPALALKLMLGERSVEVLKSTTVSSSKLQNAGFHFQYPHIQDALQNLIA